MHFRRAISGGPERDADPGAGDAADDRADGAVIIGLLSVLTAKNLVLNSARCPR